MKTPRTPITPVEQAIVYIAGFPVLAVRLADNRIAVVFRMLCNLLHLDYSGQLRQVRGNPIIAGSLLLVTIETHIGARTANVIVDEAMKIWLAEISLNKVAPEARKVVEELQNDAFDAIRRKFSLHTEEAPKQAPPAPEPASANLAALSATELFTAVKEYLTTTLEEWKQWRKGVEERLDGDELQIGIHTEQIEAFIRIYENIARRLPAASPLLVEHQAELRTRLLALAHQTGKTIGALERELSRSLGLALVNEIPETSWEKVAVWFRQQLGW